MKQIIFLMISFPYFSATAQTTTTSNLIEGGKTLVELISVLKKNKRNSTTNLANKNVIDSCATKQKADLCFKNSSTKDLAISLYKRTDAGYEAEPFTMKVISKKTRMLV
jgi:hypothetical protein